MALGTMLQTVPARGRMCDGHIRSPAGTPFDAPDHDMGTGPRGRETDTSRIPQLVAVDLDGTLVGDGFAISSRSALALRRVAAAGAAVVLVTGRAVRRLSRVYTELDATYLAICANGAVVYDPYMDQCRACQPLEPARVREVCGRLRARAPSVVFAAEVEAGRRLLHEPEWYVPHEDRSATRAAPLDELADGQVVKLSARAPGCDPESFNRLVLEEVGDLVEATRPGYGGLVEMTQRNVTKATTLATLAAESGVSAADVLAFGDMPNDISMLRWAGRSVAVANAHPEVRLAAAEITLANVDDGVAVYLERLLVRCP